MKRNIDKEGLSSNLSVWSLHATLTYHGCGAANKIYPLRPHLRLGVVGICSVQVSQSGMESNQLMHFDYKSLQTLSWLSAMILLENV